MTNRLFLLIFLLAAKISVKAQPIVPESWPQLPTPESFLNDIYHTVVVAPATSNTVAKCAYGISDSLPTNMFAQAGKRGIPGIVFACDTEPVVVTRSPHDWVTLRPRRIELDNVERLRGIDFCRVVTSPAELEAALGIRLKEISRAWNTSSS